MKEDVKFCGFVDCDREFKPRQYTQIYCCPECRKAAKKLEAQQKKLKKTADNTAKFKPVFEFIKKHHEETGELLSYGKAEALIQLRKAGYKR